MAYIIINQNRETGYTEYVAEQVSDLATIPGKEQLFGCMAYCIENKKFYIMNDNSEWEVASEMSGGGGTDLPSVTSDDNGDVLTVVNGEWNKAAPATPPSELPEVTGSDNGDVLTVVNGAWDKATPNSLPSVTNQDNGKTLIVKNGAWTKQKRTLDIVIYYDYDENKYVSNYTYEDLEQNMNDYDLYIASFTPYDNTTLGEYPIYNIPLTCIRNLGWNDFYFSFNTLDSNDNLLTGVIKFTGDVGQTDIDYFEF